MAAGTELERLIVRLIGDATSYQRMLKDSEAATKRTLSGIQRMGAQMERVGRSINKVGRSMQSFGRSMALRVTAPLAIIGGMSVRAFSQFDQAMTESTSIMKVTGDQVEQMRKQALDLGTKGKQGPSELAEAYFFLASAGLDAEQSMAALPQVAQFATAGAFDMALATDLLTDAQTALGMASTDAGENLANLTTISDAFVTANQMANTSVQQISEAMTADAATASRGFGQSLASTVAVLSAYASAGKKGAEAGNLYGRATRLMASAQMKNAGVFKKYGINVVNELTGEYHDMIDIIADMETAFGNLSGSGVKKALSELGFEALAQKSITPLLGMSDAMRGYRQRVDEMGSATADVANKQMKSFANQMKVMKNQITAFAIGIGETLSPYLLELNEHIKQGLAFWKKLSPGIKRSAIAVAAVVAAVGPALIVFGGLVSLLGFVVSGIGSLITAIGPLVVAGGILTVIVIAFRSINAELDIGGQLVKWFAERWATLKDTIGPTVDAIKNALGKGDVQLAFKLAWAQIHLSFIEGIAPLRKAWADYIHFFKDAWIVGTSVVKSVWQEASLSIQALILTGMKKTGAISHEAWVAAMKGIESDSRRGFKNIANDQTAALLASAEQAALDKSGSVKLIAKLKKDLLKLREEAGNAVAGAGPEMPDFIANNVREQIEAGIASVKPAPIELTFITGRNAVALGSAEAERRLAEFQASASPMAARGGDGAAEGIPGLGALVGRGAPTIAGGVRIDPQMARVAAGIESLVALGEAEAERIEDEPGDTLP